MLVLHIVVVLVLATALAWWCGWGLVRLALPSALLPFRRLLAPLIGYAAAAVAGYWSVRTVIGLNAALPLLLLISAALNILAWRRTGAPFTRRLSNQVTRNEGILLFLLILTTIFVGVAPLIRYNQSAAIGGGWDIEVALPMARYLERAPVAAIATMPDNPLRDLVAHPPRISHNIGFAVWQGCVDLLGGFEAFDTFTPLIAWLRGMGALAVYLWLRTTLGLRVWAALVGSAWVSANALLLWIAYFNFEKQLAGFPLIPLCLVIGMATVEEIARNRLAAWRSALLGSVTLAALPVVYYPAITVWAALALGLGGARLIEAIRKNDDTSFRTLISAAAGLLALTLMAAAPTIEDYFSGFDFRYGHQVTSLGIFHYIPASTIAGLTPFQLENADSVAPKVAEQAAGITLIVLMATALVYGPYRLRLGGVLIGCIAYLAWLRWWQAYPYAYMKGAAYISFAVLGVAAAGVQGLWQQQAPRWFLEARRAYVAMSLRALSIVAALGLCAVMAFSQARIVSAHMNRPGLYPDDAPVLLQLRTLVPQGSTVTMTSDKRVRGVINGFAAYALDHAVVWGHVRTGYAESRAGGVGAIGEYGLLYAFEDPLLWGYASPPVWRGGSYALYRRPPGVQSHVRLLHVLAPGEVLPAPGGAEPVIEAHSPVASHTLRLMVATLEATTIEINGSPVTLLPGRRTIMLPGVSLHDVIIRNAGAMPLLIETATVLEAPEMAATQAMSAPRDSGVQALVTTTTVHQMTNSAVVHASATASGTLITTMLDTFLPDTGPLRVALDIWDVDRGVQYGWYGLLVAPASEVQRFSMVLSLADGHMRCLSANGEEPIGAYFAGLQPGRYTARLYLAAGAQVVSEPIDLFGFDVASDRAISGVWVRERQMQAVSVANPATPARVQVGSDVVLMGYTLLKPRLKAGEAADLTLWWQSLRDDLDERSVLVHLVDAAGNKYAQGDGPPAEGVLPTSAWRAGLTIIDARRILVPADLPPGDYVLLVGMYRWPSLERLPLVQNDMLLPDAVVRIPVRIED